MNYYSCGVPFEGFYNSTADGMLDDGIEQLFSDFETGEPDFNKMNGFYGIDGIKWDDVHSDFCREYVSELNNILGISLKFIKLTSPAFYNYSTDKIEAEISKADLLKLYSDIDIKLFIQLINAELEPSSGFIPFYSNDFYQWDNDVLKWEYPQIELLIQHTIDNNISNTWPLIYEIMEDPLCNGFIDQIINDNLTEKGIDYLNRQSD